MCSIWGSYNAGRLEQLYNLNTYRGVVATAISHIAGDADGTCTVLKTMSVPGPMGPEVFQMAVPWQATYMLGHSQAPTSGEGDETARHPAYAGIAGQVVIRLWHNGIIKQKSMDAYNKARGTNFKWDTAMLADALLTDDMGEALNQFEGSFACIAIIEDDSGSRMYAFRNEIAPLFVDSQLSISSTKFEGSHPLEPNTIFQFDLIDGVLIDTGMKFKTVDNPFYFGAQ